MFSGEHCCLLEAHKIMEFFPRELCEKLVKLGCVSESRMYWGRLICEPDSVKDSVWFDVEYSGGLILKRIAPYGLADGMNVFNPKRNMIFCVPIFIEQDFTGCSEIARENAVKRWGAVHTQPNSGSPICLTCGCLDFKNHSTCAEHFRHAMIDYKGLAWGFVAKGLGE